MKTRTRAALHAGSWYVAESNFHHHSAAKLEAELNEYLNRAKLEVPDIKQIKGLIGPHAGYYYSGPTAAWAYKYLSKADK